MLGYCEDFSSTNAIRVDVINNRDNLSWAVFDLTGNILRECKRGAFLFPGLTEEEIKEARATIQTFRPAPYGKAYIRYNELPEKGKSVNHATGIEEAGVSCYTAQWDLATGSYKRTGTGLDGAAIFYLITGAPVYLIDGEEVGIGSDGEPLLKDVKILCRLKYDKTADGYIPQKI